jgi:hypothetical protein
MDSRIKSKSVWVEAANDMHGHRYDYSLVPDGVASKVKFDILCPQHGSFSKSWNEHTKGKGMAGCPSCTNQRLSGLFQDTLDVFIEKALKAHGERYSYAKVEYVASQTKVVITCKDHGDFHQQPYKHIAGQGCPQCVRNGFRPEKPAHLYVLSDGVNVKVGITNRRVSTRVAEINTGGGCFTLVSKHYFEDGRLCHRAESLLLAYLRSMYQTTAGTFSGVTESFVGADIDAVSTFIRSINDG